MFCSRVSLLIVPMLLFTSFGVLFFATDEAVATTFYYGTTNASAYNSSYWRTYARYSTSPVSLYEAQVSNDTYTEDLYTTASLSYVETNDFTNPTYYFDPTDMFIGGRPMDIMPPDNGTATVDYVWVSVRFVGAIPPCYLYFSPNDKSTWHTSSYLTGKGSTYYWDVTSVITWNATVLNSNELWAKMKAYPVSGIHYYIDYIGISVRWHADYLIDDGYGIPIEDPPDEPIPDEEGGAQLDYDLIYSADGITGILGFVGLIGMIAVPAFGVFVYRANQGEGKMNIFIKMLVLFMFCLTCFMVSVSGA